MDLALYALSLAAGFVAGYLLRRAREGHDLASARRLLANANDAADALRAELADAKRRLNRVIGKPKPPARG